MSVRPTLARVVGPNLALRLIEPSDAAYVHGLRIDPALNQHLSAVHGGVEEQRAWIAAYKDREAAGQEYYYIIERRDGQRCGTVRLYGLEADQFTWGSWILDANKPPKAALESALLVYQVGFDLLGRSECVFEVRAMNERTLDFHRRFGATETHRAEGYVHFVYSDVVFEADRAVFVAVLKSEDQN